MNPFAYAASLPFQISENAEKLQMGEVTLPPRTCAP